MFPAVTLEHESWEDVQGLFLPLMNDIAFDLITTSNITLYLDAKNVLLRQFGKS